MHKSIKKLLSVSLAFTIFTSNLAMDFSHAAGPVCNDEQCSLVPNDSSENSKDMENIRIKVVDKEGTPVKNTIFTLKDEMTAGTRDYKTDDEGICAISIEELNNSDFTIELSDPQYAHLIDRTVIGSKREYKINKIGNTVTFDEKAFDGKVKTIHLNTVVESEDSFKEVDNENIRLKITDKKGNPISGVKYTIMAFGEDKPLDVAPSDENGLIIIPIADLEARPYELKIDDAAAEKYNVVEGKNRYVLSNNSTPIAIAGKPHDGRIIDIQLEEKGSTDTEDGTKPDEGETTPGTGTETKPEEKGDLTKLKVKIVDKNKKPVKGVKIDFIDTFGSGSGAVIGKYTSDENGLVNITNPEFMGTYAVSLNPDSKYEISTPGKDLYKCIYNMKKEWQTVDGKDYNGKEFVIEVKERTSAPTPGEDDTKPEVKFDKIRVKVIDQKGQPIEGIGFKLLDMQNGGNSAGSYETDKHGYIIVEKPVYDGSYKLDLSNRGNYDPKIPNKFHYELKCDGKGWTNVEGKKFDGAELLVELVGKDSTGTPEVPVDPVDPVDPGNPENPDTPEVPDTPENKLARINVKFVDENNAPIKGAKIDYIDVNNNDKVVETLVTDKDGNCKVGKPTQAGEFALSVKKPYRDFMFMDGSGSEYELISNDGTQWDEIDDVKYEGKDIVIKVKDVDAPEARKDTILLRVVDENGYPIKDSVFSVTDMMTFTPLKNKYKADENGIVAIKVQRKELKTASIILDTEYKKYKLDNAIPFTVDTTNVKTLNGKAFDGKPITVELKKNVWKTDLNPTYIEMPDDNTIEATFKENIEFLEKDPAKLRELIYIREFVWGSDKTDGNTFFSDKDKITVNGNRLTIKLKEPKKLQTSAKLIIKEGALITDNGGIVRNLEWAISTSSRIYETEFENDLYEYKGGEAAVHIKGNRMSVLKEDDLKIFINIGGANKPVDIPVKLEIGDEIIARFTLPENTTDKTITYVFNASVKGQTDYANIGKYGELTAASVLPKGKKKTDQTLGAMRANANDYISNNPENTDITVFAKPGEGGLKSMLFLYGTNLDATKTEVRAIDENGVIFPVNHVST